jgi:hypothetical protein
MKKLIGGWVFGILILAHSISFAQTVDIHGFVDTYYSYNFNDPDSMSNSPVGIFDFEHNAFSLSLAEVVFSKSTSDTSPVGFRLDLNFGPTAEFVHCLELSCSDGSPEAPYRNIQQAYVTWATPVGLTLDMGKFVTHMGLEVIESKDNWNYTRGLLFCCAIPFYHAGLRVNYAVSDLLFVNGYVLNGWDNVDENNKKKTFGAQVGITAIKQLPIILNWIGPEEVSGDHENRQVYDLIVTFNLNDALAFAVNYDYGTQESLVTGDDQTWTGIAGYARLGMGSNALAARYEVFDDEDGARGVGTKVQEVTLTAETKVATNLLLRLEYRRDMADADIFEDEGAPTDSQDRVVFGAVYSF